MDKPTGPLIYKVDKGADADWIEILIIGSAFVSLVAVGMMVVLCLITT